MKPLYQYILAFLLTFTITSCDRNSSPQTAPQSLPASDNSSPAESIHYNALVIGISKYSNTGWQDLGTACNDAKAVGKILREHYGFNVTELMDEQATHGNILRTFDQLMNLTEHDALLVYFAGHGYYDKQMDEGYWIPYGAQRQRMNLPAKEDWLWNSNLTRIINTIPARHVLVIADTCYGGSLFRGENEVSDKSGNWYQRAIAIPSRFLITSGNIEPVLDSGIRHSVFAQQLLNFLEYTEKNIFSASDIGIAIRTEVSELTGQLVRMGPLPSPLNAGGEFVFIRENSNLLEAQNPHPPKEAQEKPNESKNRGAINEIINPLETSIKESQPDSFVRPRVLACLGPEGGNQEESVLVRSILYRSLDRIGGCIVVERDALDQLMQEAELGRSELADSRVATRIGKLLPASLILIGEIIPLQNQKEIYLRVIDTETSRVLTSISATFSTHNELKSASETLAREIMQTMNEARPLLLKASPTPNGALIAGWGKFHGARIGDTFEIITIKAEGTISQQEISLGNAQLTAMEEEQAEFHPVWNEETTTPSTNLWLKATL